MTELSDLDFKPEARDILDRVSKLLTADELKKPEALDALYREVHTLKGSAMLFGYTELSSLLHVLETSFDPLRKQKCKITLPYFNVVQSCFDTINDYLSNMESEAIKKSLKNMIPSIIEATVAMMNARVEGGKIKELASPVSLEHPKIELPEEKITVKNVLTPIQNTSNKPEVPSEIITPKEKTVNAPTQIETHSVISHVKNERSTEQSMKVSETKPTQPPQDNSNESTSIRVSVGVLDSLMSLVGEMVLVRNQVMQFANTTDDFNFMNLSQRLDVVTSELQGEVMKTRMQPIGNILTKFSRTVRDISRELNKKIELQLEGTDTELDKTLIEIIKDPLTHIIRNSCDHGIELPQERLAKGKKETGLVKIRSYYEGGQVIVEISDDGKGLDKEKLLKKAIEKGLVQPDKASTMSDKEVYGIIFLPGFSTAAQVTNLSGRGVGMDVVRTNIEKIGGSVDISSKLNEGITIKLKIPLTLAIVPAMIIRTNNELYAIPQVKLKELVRIENQKNLEYIHNKPVYRLRGKILPLVDLKEILKVEVKSSESQSIAVLQSDQDTFGLIVDEVIDKVDIVVKPLARFLKGLNVYAGATVLGDGSLALILDVNGLAQKSLFSHRSQQTQETTGETKVNNEFQNSAEYITFKVNDNQRMCIPLDFVYRLEEVPRSQIDFNQFKPVLNYRGKILPLCFVSDLAKNKTNSKTENDLANIIVIKSGEYIFGLVVDEIRDIVHPLSALEPSTSPEDILEGSFLHQDHIYTVINMTKIIDEMIPKRENASTSKKDKHIFYVEDSPAFRKHVAHFLKKAGYQVTTAENGKMGIETLQKNMGKFDCIISDIEMPEMNGLEFARSVRKSDQFKHIPMIALTTLAQESHIKAGMDAGFDYYLEKLDETKILNTLNTALELKRSA